MNRLEISVQWKPAPPDEAFGPEKPTWARLELRVGERVLTRHRSDVALLEPGVEVEDAIEGPLSGLAEWVVDNFCFVLWEGHVPVPKLDSANGFRSGVPGLRDAVNWWKEIPHGSDLSSLAVWQERHTLGAASSQLAVPSMVFVPEATRVGLFVSPLATDLDPSIRLHLSSEQSEYWLERVDLREQLSQFVETTLRQTAEDGSNERWVNWLTARWSASREREASESERRRLRFGDAVASAWESRIAPLGDKRTIVEGVLSDVKEVASEADLSHLLEVLVSPAENTTSNGAAWRNHIPKSASGLAKPYEEGYELARRIRHDLQLGTDPIDRVDILLSSLDIQDRDVDSGEMFRSACRVQGKQATVMIDRNMRGVTARRVALATAFGRLLFESRGKSLGAAFSDHARVQETRRAGAFAAELLAPSAIVPRYAAEPRRLADDYGISHSAAEWRIFNVMRQPP